jgi:hypothetical protein
MDNRQNKSSAMVVDLAISNAMVHGTIAGARVLLNFGLPMVLVRRVLLNPDKRRKVPLSTPQGGVTPSV